jgi:hypothetical protein
MTVDLDIQVLEHCRAVYGDPETVLPRQAGLLSLGLEEVARDLSRGEQARRHAKT